MDELAADKAWFSQCIEENLDALYGTALRLTGGPADAEDLLADAIERAWSARDSLVDRRRFRHWIFRILHNGFVDAYRRKSVRPVETAYMEPGTGANGDEIATYLMEQPDEFLKWWSSPERELHNALLAEDIMAAIEALPESFRLTIFLVNVEGLTYDEAAEALGIPAGTVRSRMKRGRTLLQKALYQQASEAGIAGM